MMLGAMGHGEMKRSSSLSLKRRTQRKMRATACNSLSKQWQQPSGSVPGRPGDLVGPRELETSDVLGPVVKEDEVFGSGCSIVQQD